MDTLAVLSLVCLVVTIALGFFKKINIGIIAIGVALVLGKLGGISDSAILKYFGSSLFVRLLGVLLLFSIAQTNGTIEKLTRAAVYSMRKFPKLIPLLIFFASGILSGIAGSIPIFALMATITCALAYQLNIHPIKLIPFGIFGAIAGAVTPVSMSGVLIKSLATDAGIDFAYLPVFLASVISIFIPCLIYYLLCGWHRHHLAPELVDMKPEKMDKNQMITIAGILVMIVMTLFLGTDVGLASVFCTAILLLLKVSDEKTVIGGVPWGTLVMISGMGILISMVNDLHGIDLIANFLTRFMTTSLAPVIYVLLSGVMSFVSSAQGVVMPTLFPAIPTLVESFPGLSPLVMLVAVILGSGCTAISPFSTGGALVLGAYSSTFDPSPEERNKLFLYLIYAALGWLIALSILAGVGLFRLFF